MSSINSTVNNYISIISKKYNIKENELYEIWSGNSEISQTTSQNQELEKLSKPELIEMCKSKKLKVSGSKNDLINRIILNETQNKQQQVKTLEQQTVIKKLVEKIPKLEIKKNAFGNYEHKETSFIFDSKTQKVYGKQNQDGNIDELSSEDIDLCNKYKFSYLIPNNLDKKINILDVKVDELDDDVELEEDLEEEYEYEVDDEIEEEEEFYEE
jgi:hypothetical protein